MMDMCLTTAQKKIHVNVGGHFRNATPMNTKLAGLDTRPSLHATEYGACSHTPSMLRLRRIIQQETCFDLLKAYVTMYVYMHVDEPSSPLSPVHHIQVQVVCSRFHDPLGLLCETRQVRIQYGRSHFATTLA